MKEASEHGKKKEKKKKKQEKDDKQIWEVQKLAKLGWQGQSKFVAGKGTAREVFFFVVV